MTRLLSFVSGAVLLPAIAVAQSTSVPTPVPMPLPAPVVVAVPVQVPQPAVPVVPPMPPVPPIPLQLGVPVVPPVPFFDSGRMAELQSRMAELQSRLQLDGLLSVEDQRRIAEEARRAADEARRAAMDWNLEGRHDLNFDLNFDLQGPVIARAGGGDERGIYNNGLNALQRRQYDRAIQEFDRVIAEKGPHADAATYWRAFSQTRLVRTDDALATIAALRRDFPQSRYLGDAKVLEAEARRLAGQRIDPQTLDANDELKLIAINGIANTDPGQAIPLLEGVLNGANTLGNKRRALFVLALSKDARAHQILLRYAKGGGNPELQAEAIRLLVSRRDEQTTDAELREIYESAQDPVVRRSIIDAYGSARNKTALLEVVKSKAEKPDIKRVAINRLSGLATADELWALYQAEPDAELRMQMLNVFASMNAMTALGQVAKSEKDPKVRLRAVRNLGSQKAEASGQLLVDIYGVDQDPDLRRTVINALRAQNNAEALVAVARKETSIDLKRDIVSALSQMARSNKVAADYLMEVIK